MSNKIKFLAFFCFLFLLGVLYYWKNTDPKSFTLTFNQKVIVIQDYKVKGDYIEITDESGKKQRIPIIDVESIEEVNVGVGK